MGNASFGWIMIVVTFFALGCGKPRSEEDKLSYAIGIQFGKSLKAQNLKVNPAMVGRGVGDALSGNRQLSDAELNSALMSASAAQEKQKNLEKEKARKVSEDFLNQNKSLEGVKVTDSGLQYRIVQEGNGPRPQADDLVLVSYLAKLPSGAQLEGTSQPTQLPVKNPMSGWTEALQLMKKGTKAQFWFPPHLGYGEQQKGGVPPNAVLIYEIELIDVISAKKKARPGA